jgi:hypothetical protein
VEDLAIVQPALLKVFLEESCDGAAKALGSVLSS